MIHQSSGYMVRDYDGLIRPLCFTHAVRRAMTEMVHHMTEVRGKSCGDCLPEAPCDCVLCAVCLEYMICAKCLMCARCHEHRPGCPGCAAHARC